ncbi:hypothetical protein ACOAJ8_03920 [Arcobacter cryaerophilus gv. pseudocryaerophilus]
MANLAKIQSIAQGQFFVKDSLGNLTELKVGDTVSLNDTIVAASSNTDLSKIEILFDTNELITLSQGEQLLDTTLLASTFGNEELAFDKQEVDETLNAWNNAQDGDATDMETAAGDVTEQATNAGDERAADGGALRSKFNSRDGASTDVRSDLRDTSFGGGNPENPEEQIPTELLNPFGATTPGSIPGTITPFTTTVTVGNTTVNEDATSATVEVKLEGHIFKTGEIVTVRVGDKDVEFTSNGTQNVTFTVTPDSDSIKETDATSSITATVTSSAGEIENPVVNNGTLTVEDSTDTTTVTVGNTTVNEDATSATVEVKLEGHIFKTGEIVTVRVGDKDVEFTSNGTQNVTFTVTPDSDSIKETDATSSITATVTSSAGEIENPVVNNGTLTVEDSTDTTTVTVGNTTVNEDATSATVEVKLEGHIFKTGEIVTVRVGDKDVEFTSNGTQNVTFTVTPDSDSIKETDATSSITATVTSSAGEIENPVVNNGTLTVEDSTDTTTVTVGNTTVNEDATSATVEVKLEGHIFKTGEIVTVRVGDKDVEFTSNGTQNVTFTVTPDSDSIKETDATSSITATVTSSAGEIENPVVNNGTLTVEDSTDTTTVTVGNTTVNEDATSATVEVKLEGHIFKTGEIVTVRVGDKDVEFTSNGTQNVTFTVTPDSDSIKETDATSSITATVTSSAGEIENPVVNNGTLTVEDSTDTTTVTVGNTTVNEDATSATVEVKLEGHIFKTGEIVTVRVGDKDVEFTSNGTQNVTFTVTPDSDSIKETDATSSITATVTSSAGEIENPVVNNGTLTVEDSTDTTTVTVGNTTVNEDATSATVEVKLEGHIFKTGEIVTVRVGDKDVEFTSNGTQNVTFTVTPDSDSIKETDATSSITATVTSSAGEIENPVVNNGTLTVEDSTDTTTVTVGNTTVNEDATSATVEVKLEGHIFKTGEIVTVRVGDKDVEFTSNGTQNVTFTVTPDSDSIKETDATSSITATVTSSAGEIENPVVNNGTLTVEDSTDTTTVTVGNTTVNEDATSATVEVKLEGHIFKTGEIVTVRVGDKDVEFTSNGTQNVTFTVTPDSDSIKETDATSSITATVTSSAGEIENPVVNNGTLTVEDSTDTTTVTVGNTTVNEDATSATVEVKLEGHIFKTGEIVTVRVGDKDVEFTSNGTQNVTFTVTPDSDSIKETDATSSITATVTSSAGEIENPVVNNGTLTVEDSTDTTTVTVGNTTVNEDATSATVEVKLEGHIFKTGEIVTVRVGDKDVEFTSNGTQNVTFTVTPDSDSIKETDATSSITATVTSSAGEIENPVVNNGTLTVEDSTDTTTVTVGNTTVNEDATSATVEVKLEGHIFKTGEIVTVRVGDKDVEFTSNGTQNVTFTVTPDSDSIKETDATSSITATVTSSAGEIENPVVNNGTLTVEDSTDTTTVTVGNTTVNEDATSATVEVKLEGHIFKTGEIVTVRVGDKDVEFTSNGTQNVTFTVTPDSDSIKETDATSSITATVTSSAGEIENPVVNNGTLTVEDSTDTTTVTVGNTTVNEDATSATVEVKLEGHIFKTGEIVTVRVGDKDVEFTSNGTQNVTFTVTPDSDSIKETDATSSITATVTSSAGEIENPVVNNGTLTVEDSTDTTTVTVGNTTVNEDATSATVEVKLEGHIFKTGEIVTVRVGDKDVEFTSNGTQNVTFTVTPDSDSIKETDATSSITATVTSSAGEIENPVVNNGTLTVEDSTDTTTVTVGNTTVNEDATSATVEVKLEGHIFKTGEIVTVRVGDKDVEFTSNGTQNVTFTVTPDSDSIKETDATSSITATVTSSAGEIENPVVNNGTLTVEDSTDTTTVTVGNTTVNEDATSATVEVKLEGHIFKTGEIVTVRVGDKDVEFTSNGTQNVTFTVTPDSDSIKETDATSSITATVTSSAGEIENPVVNNGTLTVEDSTDTTTVTVGNTTVNEDATSATVEVKLEGHIFKTGEIVTVRVGDKDVEFTSNGTQNVTFTVTPDSDSIKETDATSSITATVTSSAGEIENPVVNNGTLTVEDSTDTTTVTVGNTTVNEDATSATVEVKLEGHIFKTGEIVTVRVGDKDVEFTSNGTQNVTFTVTPDSDVYNEPDSTSSITATVESNKGEIENPVVNPGTLTVEDSIDPTEVKITPIITVEKMIDKDNISDEERPFTITGYQNYGKWNQSESTLSNVDIINGQGLEVKGFGVNGDITGGNNKGDVSELQYGEAIVIDFEDKSVLGIDVAFAWRNQDESAKIEFFDKDGNAIGTATISGGANGNAGATSTITYTFKDKDGNTQTESKTIQGGSDGTDKPFELMLPNGEQFTKIVFTAPNVNDDYLINSIGYKEVIDGNSLDKGQKAEVTFIVETNHKPDPDWTNPNRTDGKPTADVKIEDSKGNVLFNGTVVLDADGKAIIPDIKADGVNDLKATVTNVQGNFELVDYSKAEAGVYVGDIETEKNTNDTITGTKGNDVIVGDEGGTSKKIVDGQNYNIAIIVDKSNSMKASSGTGSMNRMELLKASLNNLADTLANHDGVINLSIIGFGTHADTAIVFNNLTSSDLTALKNSINGLNGYNNTWNSQVGGTNYEAAFNATKAWFDGLSSSNDASYENMTYFLTDGEPTQYGTGQGTGNAYDSTADSKGQIAYNNLVNTHDVKVYAIGIGNDVSVNTLNKYDNTEIEVMDIKTNAQTIETETFSNNGNTLPTGWEHTGSGSAVVSGQKLVITDNNTSNSNFASVKSKTYEIGKDTYGKLSFDYSVSNSDYRSDDKSTIILQKLINGEWEDIGTPQTITSGSGSYKSQLLSEGEYRLVINVNDTTSSRTYKLSIDNVKLQATSDLDKLEFKKVDIVNTAEDLDAALQAGNTTYDPAKLGSDIITGGAGNDIIFGDTINTDHLTWAGRILPAGSGTEALKEMIKVQNPGISDEDLAQKMYDYIKENHASLGGDGTKDGNDTITGGEGRDIIYGQGGNDTIITDINTNNGKADGDILIDGGTGFDTIKLEGNNDIDFSKLGDIIKNIEAIDLTEGDHKLTNITLDDVLKMTDSNKELIILRDSKDSVLFKDTVGENGQAQTWLKAENSIVKDGKTFEVYTNTGDSTVQVKVEQPIDGITN